MKFSELVFPLFFIFLILVSIIEQTLVASGAASYFQSGLPFISRTYSIPALVPISTLTGRLEEHFRRNFWHPSILFWSLGEGECAFRTKFYEFRYGLRPLIYGTIKQFPEEKTVRVIITWPWTSLLVLVALFIISVVNGSLLLLIGGFLFLTFNLAIQAWLFAGYADKMAEVVQKCSGIGTYQLPIPIKQPITSRINLTEHLEWGGIMAIAGILPLLMAYLLTLNQSQPTYTTITHPQRIGSVVFSPDSSTLAIADDGHIFLRRSHDGELLTQLDTPQTSVTRLVFSPTGRLLLSASMNGDVYLWKLGGRTAQQLWVNLTPMNEHSDFFFAADETVVMGAFMDELHVNYWDTTTGELLATIAMEMPYSGFKADPIFSPHGGLLAAVDYWTGKVYIWRVNDGKLLYTFQVAAAHTSMAVAFSPDSSLLAIGPSGDKVQLWRTDDGSLLRTLGGPFPQVHFHRLHYLCPRWKKRTHGYLGQYHSLA
ncbi:MAG: hypothetical protein IPL78_10800 [Chloroflexi bacterium]|nr:hypothetical protein [Chloroflexota bacterium]